MKHEAINDDEFTPENSGTEGPPWKLLALLVVVVLLAIFFFQNGANAPVTFLWLDGQWPVWMVIGISVLIGIVLDRLGSWQWRRARRRDDG